MQLIKSALFLVGVIVFVKCITTFVPEAVSVSSTINGRELPIYCVDTQEKLYEYCTQRLTWLDTHYS